MANEDLHIVIRDFAEQTKPSDIRICDGSAAEAAELRRRMHEEGSLKELNQSLYPGCYATRTDKNDVARSEKSTYICPEDEADAGPTNNWMSPDRLVDEVLPLLNGSMKNRLMYVVPYALGPIDSPYSKIGVQLTDSPLVALSAQTMTRMGQKVQERLNGGEDFATIYHSTGNLDPDKRFICHVPQQNAAISINSNSGGNALGWKKCHALRLASVQARNEGWMAEHMAVVGLVEPGGRTTWFAAAFPSKCGKTNLAMLQPPPALKKLGYRVITLGDDIAWMHVGHDGRLWAINPEAGMFGVATNTSWKTNPNAMEMISRNTLFTNVALAPDGTPWWEGMTPNPPGGLTAWDGTPWDPSQGRTAAHGNSRFTVDGHQCPTVDGNFDAPMGVPISGIICGGREETTVPLVFESFGWNAGVYVGATLCSETTAAADGPEGVTRYDSWAMGPFCGYNMGDYFDHFVRMGARMTNPPKIFRVNWFRGKNMWPGFGENMRVIKWMADRIRNPKFVGNYDETPIGKVPKPESLLTDGLPVDQGTLAKLLAVSREEWQTRALQNGKYLMRFADRLPLALREQHHLLLDRLV